MQLRDEYIPSANRPTAHGLCIVMACTDMSEADTVGRELLELNSGCLVTYRKAEDLIHNAPAAKVALVILATTDTAVVIGRTLKWLKRRWPRCPVTVIGDNGGGQHEMVARQGAANFLTRPVGPQQWNAILAHALGLSQRTVEIKRSTHGQ